MRILVPIIAVIIALAFAAAFMLQDRAPQPAPPTEAELATPTDDAAPAPAGQTPEPSAEPAADAPEPASPETAATAPTPVELSAEFLDGLTIRPAQTPGEATLGSDDPESDFEVRVDIVRWGAGISRIDLTEYRGSVMTDERYVLIDLFAEADEDASPPFYPYSGRWLSINGKRIGPLDNKGWNLLGHDQTHATYQLLIVDAEDNPILEVRRTYRVQPVDGDTVMGSVGYDVRLEQQLINHFGLPLEVQWSQYAHGDVVNDGPSYLGDRRLYVTGYFADKQDPRRVNIYTHDGFTNRDPLISGYIKAQRRQEPPGQRPDIWPNADLDRDTRLVWFASANRYFTLATHRPVPEPAAVDDKPATRSAAHVPELQAIFPDLGMRVFPDYTRDPEAKPNDRQLIFTLDSDTITLAPGKAADLDLAIFAGPRDSGLFAQEPYATLGFGELLRYELGCTWCTFQWLARLLLGLLTGIHFVVRDWGVSIIILVLIVRGLLHPLTKGAQVRMMLTSKQMQALQPELEKVRTKYKGNAQKIQQETMRLYNEKGVNFANMLGCLPMLLQMPIWVALYAMLYFAIELRHQEAFYGVFQMISGGHWHFLESLSSSDRFIKLFDKPMPINLFMIVLDFQYFNILPILMGVVFFFQQKFMQPPPPENETPEAADRRKQQMMIMRIMMLTFPFFLYSAPSGLTLYILASTGAGILDSYLVRKHVKEKEAAGDLFKKKPVKPGGFRDRLHKMYEHRMKELQTAQKGKGGGRKR